MPSRKRERQEMDDEGVRKKLKTSPQHDPSAITPVNQPIMDPPAEDATPVDAPKPASQELQVLQLLRGDFDDLRQLITCKICERLLYEPYVISCGHTYCYSCLCTWFATTKKKTCPNCREVITQPPAPSYVIKEMTHIFMRRHDLLPDGETIEQHEQWKEEEADIVRRDRSDADPRTGGLFKGLFHPRPRKLLPVHDPVDHVDRCPQCNWEIEDGMCNNCGIHMDTDSDSSNSLDEENIPDDFDDDDDLDADAGFGEYDVDFDPRARADHMQWHDWGLELEGRSNYSDDTDEADALRRHAAQFYHGLHGADFRRFMPAGYYDEDAEDDENNEDDDEDEDEDDTGSIDDFIDDRDANDITTYTISSQPEEQPTRRRNRHVLISSDDGEHSESSPTSSRTSRNGAISGSGSDSESDGVRHNPRYRQPVYEISDEDESDVPRVVGRRPVPVHDLDDSEEDEPRIVGFHHRQPTVARRQRHIRIPDSDDESRSETDGQTGDSDSEANETSRNLGQIVRGNPEEQDSQGSGTDDDAIEGESFDDHRIRDYDDGDLEDESVSNEGFSPMQSENEDQSAMDAYNVYGQPSDDDNWD